ncbi:MAG: hypothetical protein ABIH23_10630 [bacterium]
MGRLSIVFSIALLLFPIVSPIAVHGDGGVLEYRSDRLPQDFNPWMIENARLVSSRKADARLDNDTKEDVFIVYQGAWKLLFTRSGPHKLLCDLNDDGQFQPGEIFTGKPLPSNDGWIWENITLPASANNATYLTVIDIAGQISRRRVDASVQRVHNRYEGSLTIDGRNYQTCLAIRDPFQSPHDNQENGIIILDTNEDGVFDHFADPWLKSSGVGYLDGKLWEVETELSDNSAQVSLTPYEGPTGQLQIEGEGLYRLYIGTPQRSEVRGGEPDYLICLPQRSDQTYTLPVHEFSVKNVWLRGSDESEIVYEPSFNDGTARDMKASVPEGATVSLMLGGPLKEKINVNARPLVGLVRLGLTQCSNSAGIKYVPIPLSQAGKGMDYPRPHWEIRDSENSMIKSGRFEYG